MIEANSQRGKLPQDCGTVALILGVVAVLQCDEIWTTARKTGQQTKHAFRVQWRHHQWTSERHRHFRRQPK